MLRRLMITAFAISTLMLTSNAQDFPASEKEATDILCAKTWTLKTIEKGEKKMNAKDAGMETLLVFKSDGTYTINVFGMDRSGKWTLDLGGKQVKMFEKRAEPESQITGLKKEEMLMTNSEKGDMKLIFAPLD